MANNLTCEYTRSRSQGSRRGQKQAKPRRRSGDSSRDDSPTSTRTSSASTPQLQQQASRSRPTSRILPSNAPPMGTVAYTQGIMTPTVNAEDEGDHERMLDRFDFTSLGPYDGFDLQMLSPSEYPQHYHQHTPTSSAGSGYGQPLTSVSYTQQSIPAVSQHSPYDGWQATQYHHPVTSGAPSHDPRMAIAEQGGHSEFRHSQYQQDMEYQDFYAEEDLDPRLWPK